MVKRKDQILKSILQTLVYSDIFDYPLSKDEIWKFWIGKKVDKKTFDKFLKGNLPKRIVFRNNFYCLFGREKIVQTRLEREKESEKKLGIAKKIIKLLSFIPTIHFIAISGALALKNSHKDDDIDLFVITSKGSLWLSRFIIIVILSLLGYYRRRNESKVSNKICLNMLIDESALSFPKSRQNLYTAHEIVQMMPVFERNNVYNRFISTNKWVGKFLPNAFVDRGTTQINTRNYAESFISVFLRKVQRFSALEHLAKAVQLLSIRKHQTTETISDNFLAFHPFDYKEKVLSEYKKRLKQYEV